MIYYGLLSVSSFSFLGDGKLPQEPCPRMWLRAEALAQHIVFSLPFLPSQSITLEELDEASGIIW